MIRPLAWTWMGIVIGVSFLATPVKFTADSLTRPVALDVGRATFHALNYLEWALTIALAALIWHAIANGNRPPRRALVAAVIIAATVATQSAWLLPALDERVASIIAGTEPPPSHLHTLYGIIEITKVATLGLLGRWAAPSNLVGLDGNPSPRRSGDEQPWLLRPTPTTMCSTPTTSSSSWPAISRQSTPQPRRRSATFVTG